MSEEFKQISRATFKSNRINLERHGLERFIPEEGLSPLEFIQAPVDQLLENARRRQSAIKTRLDILLYRPCLPDDIYHNLGLFAARRVLTIFENAFPGVAYPREAIDAKERWLKGELDPEYLLNLNDSLYLTHIAHFRWLETLENLHSFGFIDIYEESDIMDELSFREFTERLDTPGVQEQIQALGDIQDPVNLAVLLGGVDGDYYELVNRLDPDIVYRFFLLLALQARGDLNAGLLKGRAAFHAAWAALYLIEANRPPGSPPKSINTRADLERVALVWNGISRGVEQAIYAAGRNIETVEKIYYKLCELIEAEFA